MKLRNKRIVITAGEPASISTEITLKSMLSNKLEENVEIIFATDPVLVQNTKIKNCHTFKTNILNEKKNFEDYKHGLINILPIKLKKKSIPGELEEKNCSFVKNSILKSVDLVQSCLADAIVTNPINKFIMKKSGFKYPGHTEFLATLSKIKTDPIMLLESKKLRVIPLTTHIAIKEVPKLIKKDFIITKLKIIFKELQNTLNISKPKIIVSGLNPHSGDNGEIGSEEIQSIIPAISHMSSKGYNITGPHSADTLFQKQNINKFDAIVCMFHDQALIAIKTLSFNDIVNITLGIDFIRTSPDHGTALDIAGKDKANPVSLIKAINKASELIHQKNL